MRLHGEGFHSRNDEQHTPRSPGRIIKHEPDAVEHEKYIADKIYGEEHGAAVYDYHMLPAADSCDVPEAASSHSAGRMPAGGRG